MVNKVEVFFFKLFNFCSTVRNIYDLDAQIRKRDNLVVIVYHTRRDQMIKATIQLSENYNHGLFTDITKTSIVSKIERLLK